MADARRRATSRSASCRLPRLVGERVDGLELALVVGKRQVEAAPAAGWRASSTAAPGPTVRPVSQPPASGLHGMTPMPYCCAVGSTSPRSRGPGSSTAAARSMKRSRPRRSATHCASTIWLGGERRGAEVRGSCRRGRDRSARRASRRCRWSGRAGGSGRGRSSRCRSRRRLFSTSSDDPAPRVAGVVGVLAHLAVGLGREHHVVALAARQGLADDLLRLARASTRRRCR